jgi:hypothetical protein
MIRQGHLTAYRIAETDWQCIRAEWVSGLDAKHRSVKAFIFKMKALMDTD